MSSWIQDLRFAFRTLAKSPGFTAAAALTLALGIGANAASFSVVDALLIHPYRVADLDRLQLIYARDSGSSAGASRNLTYADYLDLQRGASRFEAMAAAQFSNFNLSGTVQPERAEGFLVEPRLFSMLEAKALAGRVFGPDDARPGEDAVLLLSEPIWRSRFAADPAIVGTTVRVNGRPCRIVGVMPREFHYPLGAQVWLPLVWTPEQQADRSKPHLQVIARLRAGAPPREGREELASLGAGFARTYPQSNAHRDFTLLPLRQEQYDYTLGLFGLVQFAAVFVLALAAANVCGLLVARALVRETETAIRTALGARRADLFRVTMAEVLLIAGLGAFLGIALGSKAVDAIRAAMPPGIAIWLAGWYELTLTGWAVAVSALVAVAITVAIAAFISLRRSGLPLEEALRPALASRAGSHRGQRALRVLAISQVALAAVLLASAGLLVVGFRRVTASFETHAPENLLTFDVDLPPAQYPDAAGQSAFFQRLLDRLSAMPGVEIAAAVRNPPASNVDSPLVRYEIEGRSALRESDLPQAGFQAASPGYLRAFHIPLLSGRDFEPSDGPTSPAVALISRNVARREFPNGDAIGKRVRLRNQNAAGRGATPQGWATIVGVVSDVRQNWFDLEPPPALYFPIEQAPRESLTFAVRPRGDAVALAPAARAAVAGLDPDLPLGTLGPFRDRIVESLAPVRIIGVLLAVFGATALALAMVGVYGVTAQNVARRRRELGVRLALGAAPRGLVSAVLTQSMRLSLIGLLVSLPLVDIAARLLASRVFGLVAPDRLMLAEIFLSLLAVSAAASIVPALRVTRVDPAEALRLE